MMLRAAPPQRLRGCTDDPPRPHDQVARSSLPVRWLRNWFGDFYRAGADSPSSTRLGGTVIACVDGRWRTFAAWCADLRRTRGGESRSGRALLLHSRWIRNPAGIFVRLVLIH